MSRIVIGTRGSRLALWQANFVKESLEKEHDGLTVELEIIHTKGDKILDTPLAMVGGKGLFVKELETALLDKSVDIAVHSMKDLPSELPEGLFISAILEREDPRDAFVSTLHKSFAKLPKNAKVGTSSLRRKCQLLCMRNDLEIVSLRGNVDTRLRKLDEENFDAIILASAGLIRMGYEKKITEYLSITDSIPAVAQGAIGIEARGDDLKINSLLSFLDHAETRAVVECERSFLARLEGGCQVPIAGHAKITEQKINFTGLVGSVDGSQMFRHSEEASSCHRVEMGIKTAEKLLDMGGRKILEDLYKNGLQN